jgi:hypothetical protein
VKLTKAGKIWIGLAAGSFAFWAAVVFVIWLLS